MDYEQLTSDTYLELYIEIMQIHKLAKPMGFNEFSRIIEKG